MKYHEHKKKEDKLNLLNNLDCVFVCLSDPRAQMSSVHVSMVTKTARASY